jgi:hypothetical protein
MSYTSDVCVLSEDYRLPFQVGTMTCNGRAESLSWVLSDVS